MADRRFPGRSGNAARFIVAQSFAVDVAKHGRALGAARPVATGAILTGRKRPTFGRRAGQDVMPVRRKTHARNDLTPVCIENLIHIDCLTESPTPQRR